MLQLLGSIACVVFVVKLLWAIPGVTSQKRSDKAAYGRVVLVTGATDGIGRACAIELAKKNIIRLILAGRNQDKLDALKQELVKLVAPQAKENGGPIIETLRYDFSDDKGYERLCQEILERGPDSLINCAGISYPSALYFHELPLEFIDRLITVNVTSAIVVACAVLRSKIARESTGGSLLFMGSASSTLAEPLLAAYGSTKAAVAGFSSVLNNEYAGSRIGIQTQEPLMISTKMSKIKTASLFVPSASTYAKNCLNALLYASNQSINNSMSPLTNSYYPHLLLTTLGLLLPKFLWERVRLSEQKVIRSRYLKKTKGVIEC